MGARAPGAATAALGQAEREVVELVLEGHSNASIARARRTSIHTVANQLASVFEKLGVSSRVELAVRWRAPRADALGALLTERERLVAEHLASGRSNKWTAYELGVSEAWVSRCLKTLAAKLGARSRIDLARLLNASRCRPGD